MFLTRVTGVQKWPNFVDFTNHIENPSPNRAYNGSKNCFRGTCPKTFVDGRNAFWRGQKIFPREILTPQTSGPQTVIRRPRGDRGPP